MPKEKTQSKNKQAAASAAPYSKKVVVKKAPVEKENNPLFEKRPKIFGIGGDLHPGRDLTHFVKWPKYIRLQRQRRILYSRLKVPPAIHQFSRTLDKNTATELFKILTKYKPEDKKSEKATTSEESSRTS